MGQQSTRSSHNRLSTTWIKMRNLEYRNVQNTKLRFCIINLSLLQSYFARCVLVIKQSYIFAYNCQSWVNIIRNSHQTYMYVTSNHQINPYLFEKLIRMHDRTSWIQNVVGVIPPCPGPSGRTRLKQDLKPSIRNLKKFRVCMSDTFVITHMFHTLFITHFTFITFEFHLPEANVVGRTTRTSFHKRQLNSFCQGWGVNLVSFPSDPAVMVCIPTITPLSLQAKAQYLVI